MQSTHNIAKIATVRVLVTNEQSQCSSSTSANQASEVYQNWCEWRHSADKTNKVTIGELKLIKTQIISRTP